jgi:glycerol kinase
VYQSLTEISGLWQQSVSFFPKLSASQRENLYHGWKKAVMRAVTQPQDFC